MELSFIIFKKILSGVGLFLHILYYCWILGCSLDFSETDIQVLYYPLMQEFT